MNLHKIAFQITCWSTLSAIFLLSHLKTFLPVSDTPVPEKFNPEIQLGATGSHVYLLQMGLNGLGCNFNNFKISGIFDKKTQQIVESYQDSHKLLRSGIVDNNMWKILSDNIKAVQKELNFLGYNAGYPDGRFSQGTIKALKKFQKDNLLDPDGIVNPRTQQKLFNPYLKNYLEFQPTSNSINSLNSHVAELARKFINLAKANNLEVRIITAFRSWDAQDQSYAKGRTKPGHIITNAQGGESFHNWGLAFDAAPFKNRAPSKDLRKYKLMGKFAEQAGLEWGGNFKDIVDLYHFQYSFGLNTEALLNGVRPPNQISFYRKYLTLLSSF